MGMPTQAGSNRGGRRRSSRKPFTEINIIPLTDVVLVLLIIFMVTAQFIEPAQNKGMGLNLPTASEVNDLDDLGGLRISVTVDGAMSLDGQPIDPAQLEQLLIATRQSPEQLVIVEGDRDTVLQNVVTIMDAALACGMPNVVLATAADPLPGEVTEAQAGEAAPTAPVAMDAAPAADATPESPFASPMSTLQTDR